MSLNQMALEPIFVDPVLKQIEGAKLTGTGRVELYTESYASFYKSNRIDATALHSICQVG